MEMEVVEPSQKRNLTKKIFKYHVIVVGLLTFVGFITFTIGCILHFDHPMQVAQGQKNGIQKDLSYLETLSNILLTLSGFCFSICIIKAVFSLFSRFRRNQPVNSPVTVYSNQSSFSSQSYSASERANGEENFSDIEIFTISGHFTNPPSYNDVVDERDPPPYNSVSNFRTYNV